MLTPKIKLKLRSCCEVNLLTILCCLFGLFWCSLAVTMLTMYLKFLPAVQLQGVPYKGRAPPIPTPCELKFCAYGADCKVDSNNDAYCECPQPCSNDSAVYSPVCGSDNVTYSSECHLRATSCQQQRRIKISFARSCDIKDPCENMKCNFGAECVPALDGLSASCQCPDRCDSYGDSVDSTPVCGNDGKDYNNKCEMRKAACNKMKEIGLKYLGKCDPCRNVPCEQGKQCKLDEDRKPVCTCDNTCDNQGFAPVCGTDGRTYSNQCIMEAEGCRKRKTINIQFHGECDERNNPCNEIDCREGEDCYIDRHGAPSCQCPAACELYLRPVCGTDGKTYDNECEMKRYSCMHQRNINIDFIGTCAEDGPCSNFKCTFHGTCVVKNNRPECQCPSCSGQYEPVCGSDGKTYENECRMRATSCRDKTNINIRYRGPCENKCDFQRCDFYSVCQVDERTNEPKCVCPSTCVALDDKVCGTDGVTYMNECNLRVSSCQKKQFIMIASRGTCDRCLSVKCPNGARCEDGQCVCPQHCPSTEDKVCGTDGTTYQNECELKREACIDGRDMLEVEHAGECTDEISGGGSGAGTCDVVTCEKYGGICDVDAEGSNVCLCNIPCPAIRMKVCGSDGVIYVNQCELTKASCQQQKDIKIQTLDMCDDDGFEDFCDGQSPVKDMSTGSEFDCTDNKAICPQGSYCHQINGIGKCCKGEDKRKSKEDTPIKTCQDTKYGCCPTGGYAAKGFGYAGCPSVCRCNSLGSLSKTCDPVTSQCNCKPGVGGRKCDRCDPGYWGLPLIARGNSGCTPCGCNPQGSVRDDCEQMDGRCVCALGYTGDKCHKCADGRRAGPTGCSRHRPSTVKYTDGESPRSCDEVDCRFGGSCEIRHGLAECVCPRTCPTDGTDSLVCGSNGMTFGSECQLKQHACRRQKEVGVKYEGPCSEDESTTEFRSRKTTRHLIDNKDTTKDREEFISTPTYGNIGDLCGRNEDCVVEHSFCQIGMCTCKGGYAATKDKTTCKERDPCNPEPCLNGGKCAQDGADYKCSCPLGKGGKKCEAEMKFTVPSFDGDSYLVLKRLHHVNRETVIDLKFSTYNNDGILLYSAHTDDGKGDFISLAIIDGHVQFRFDLGNGVATLTTEEKVTLNKFHSVRASRSGQDGILKLDDGKEVKVSSPGSLKSLNLATPVYLGYISGHNEEMLKDVGTTYGLVGCIDSLRIQGSGRDHEYDLMYPASLDIDDGWHIGECGESPCSSLPCLNAGTCMKEDMKTFTCVCQIGFTGPKCQVDLSKPCESRPCQSGGMCEVTHIGFTCKCPAGKIGIFCEKDSSDINGIKVPKFSGRSYVQLPLESNIGKSLYFEIWFLATEANGALLYAGQNDNGDGDFISLNLINGYVQFRFDLGSGLANITTKDPVTLNTWHKVKMTRTNRLGLLAIDEELSVEGESGGSLQELNLQDYVFIGGFRGRANPSSGVTRGFNGAIQRVYEDKQLRDDLISGAKDFHDISEYMGKPCGGVTSPCHNGATCIPMLNDFVCVCTKEFQGKTCKKKISSIDINQPLKFSGNTYLKYLNEGDEKVKGQKTNKFEINLKTTAEDGLILLQQKSSTVQGDYQAIVLKQGYIEVSYNLGKQGFTNLHYITSQEKVNDGTWHKITYIREKRKGTLQIDGQPSVTEISEQGATQLDTDGFLWIGGKSNPPEGLPSAYRKPFSGCIQSVKVDDKDLNLAKYISVHGSLQFCD